LRGKENDRVCSPFGGKMIGNFDWFPSLTLAWTFEVVFYLWLLIEMFNIWILGRNRQAEGTKRKDQGSLWIILILVTVCILVGLNARAYQLGLTNPTGQYFGLGLVIFGIAFRLWAILLLGRFYKVSVTFLADQSLVTSGPYRWLRHPSYTGAILTLTGFPLLVGTWAGAVLAFFISLAGYYYRVRVEEKVLLENMGNVYKEYMKHTWRFFPGL